MADHSISSVFSRIAQWTANQCGRASTFITACIIIIVWAVTGPVFGYSDTWQLIINTGTTIVTFLMVFLMQNTQNRDTVSIQLKLDELIRANENARNAMLSLEDLTEDQLKRIKATFAHLSESPPAATQRKLAEASEHLADAGANVEATQEKVLNAAVEAPLSSRAHDKANAA
jgi:low affinity Fe/Cu permease